jgi:hypothetical protein
MPHKGKHERLLAKFRKTTQILDNAKGEITSEDMVWEGRERARRRLCLAPPTSVGDVICQLAFLVEDTDLDEAHVALIANAKMFLSERTNASGAIS